MKPRSRPHPRTTAARSATRRAAPLAFSGWLVASLALLACVTGAAHAQTASDGAAGASSEGGSQPVAGAGGSSASTGGTAGGGRRSLTLVPTLDVSSQWTDVRANPDPARNGQTLASRLAPGFKLDLRSGRVQGSMGYSLTATERSGSAGRGGVEEPAFQNALAAQFAAELAPSWLFLDTRASISQQAISAFGQQQVADSALANDNRTEVGNLLISPYARGRLANLASYEVRLSASETNARNSISADSSQRSGSVSLSSLSGGARLGWGAGLSHQVLDYRAGRETSTDRYNLSLVWRPDIDWEASVRGGQERTDIGGLDKRVYDNWGFGLRWVPGVRTEVNVALDRRFFGDGWLITAQHRTPRTVWRLSSTRDSSGGAGATDGSGAGQPVTVYQLFMVQFASRFPDPVERDQQVRDFLRALAINPDTLVGGGSSSAAVTLQERHDISAAWTGVRTSVTLQAQASDSRVIDDVGNQAPNEGRVKQFSWTVGLGYRLTPTWGLSLTGSRLHTRGNGLRAGNGLKSVSAGFSGQLSRRTTLSLTSRYAVFNSAQDPYRESSVGANLGFRF